MGYGTYSRVSLDNCGQCLKYLLFVFNLLILIGGLAIAIIGIVAIASDDYYRFHDFEDNNLFRSAAFMQIVIGFLIVLFAFMGCCGAVRESKSLLLTYGVLTLIMFVLLLVTGILAVVYKGNAKEAIERQLTDTMKIYGTGPEKEDAAKESWDKLQQGGKCCGLNDYKDWARLNSNFSSSQQFPTSCCKSGKTCDQANPAEAFSDGCLRLVDKLLSFSGTISFVAIFIAIIMLLGVVFAFCVGCAL